VQVCVQVFVHAPAVEHASPVQGRFTYAASNDGLVVADIAESRGRVVPSHRGNNGGSIEPQREAVANGSNRDKPSTRNPASPTRVSAGR